MSSGKGHWAPQAGVTGKGEQEKSFSDRRHLHRVTAIRARTTARGGQQAERPLRGGQDGHPRDEAGRPPAPLNHGL